MQKEFSVIGVGSPIIDLIAKVDEDFLKGIPGEKHSAINRKLSIVAISFFCI